ncbi:alpha/beta hydrolase [Hyphococcus flavus]|uniref:Alpha/beta hydrolase n=1 Tax=Hyphococcus flavus TaxID=1866326 RepID=A0AAE9ZDR5_9PROT|nr:alpha/beta hydrolase [Hyphococcus flavus]WDI31087.1 alpha/beta hydrolase [Hyphococcus flavus]
MSLVILAALLLILSGVSGCASWTAERKAPPIGAFIEVGDERIHVVDAGPRNSDKPPLILIHGASVNLRDMKLALGDTLSADRRVIMVDRPGRGYSTRNGQGHQLTVQASAIKAVADELEVENPVVVGQSFGGAVALNYALQYQEEMSGLVLLAPVSHEWPGGVAWYNNVSSWPVAGFLLRRLLVPIYGQLTAEKNINGSFAPNAAPENYYENSGLVLLFRARDFKANASDVSNLKDQILKQQDRYGELRLPVSVVTGTADTTVSPQIHSAQLEQDIPGATLTLLPGTGHALHHVETQKIIDIINSMSEQAIP